MAEVGLDVGDGLDGAEVLELLGRQQTLAGGNRAACPVSAIMRMAAGSPGWIGSSTNIGLTGLITSICAIAARDGGRAAVEIEQQIDVGAERVAHGNHQLLGMADLARLRIEAGVGQRAWSSPRCSPSRAARAQLSA